MILICPVRPGDRNEELRFALRSWQTHLLLPGGLELWTVGHKPEWLEPDRHIEGNAYSSVALAVFDNVHTGALAATEAEVREVLFMNDDFFCLDPVSAVPPVRRDCTLAEHIAKFPARDGMWWPHSLRVTASWLAEQGFPHPESFEVHRPLPAHPEVMAEALSLWPRPLTGMVPQWRTVYGAFSGVEATPVQDSKLGRTSTGYGTPWVSTSDESWRLHSRHITPRFQKPSRWERSD